MGLLDVFRRRKAHSAPGASFSVSQVRRTHHVSIDGRPAGPEEIAGLERKLGVDIDGDERIDGGEFAPPGGIGALIPGAVLPVESGGPSDQHDERVALLERLQALRDDGVLTDFEFAAEKAKILEH